MKNKSKKLQRKMAQIKNAKAPTEKKSVISQKTISELNFAIKKAKNYCLLKVCREKYGLSYSLYSGEDKDKVLRLYFDLLKNLSANLNAIIISSHYPDLDIGLILRSKDFCFFGWSKKHFPNSLFNPVIPTLNEVFPKLAKPESENEVLESILSDYDFSDLESDFQIPEIHARNTVKRNTKNTDTEKVSTFFDIKVSKKRLSKIVAEINKRVATKKLSLGFSGSKSVYNPDYAKRYYSENKFELSIYARLYSNTLCEYNGLKLKRSKLARLFKAQGEKHPFKKAREFVLD